MPRTRFIGGVSLTTALQTLVSNMAADAKIRTYVVDFVNIDGTNAADVTSCSIVDSSASNASCPVLPVNSTVRIGRDGALSRRVTLDPGDSLRASASAAGDIYATVTQVFEEAAP